MAVMGLDKTGQPALRALLAAGAKVWAWDDVLSQLDVGRALGAEIVDLTTADFSGVTALVLTPGAPPTHPAANQAGDTPIVCDVDLLCATGPQARMVGVTGTNGKSTTTALIGHIIKQAGLPVAVGGNIGISALDLPMLGPEGVYVLELSSYQLERCPHLSLDVAVFLNLTPDHLARHGDMEGYRRAKANIFRTPRQNATAVYGVDDSYTKSTGDSLEGWQKVQISQHKVPLPLDNCPTLLGLHNAQNAAAAIAACRALGLRDEVIQQGLASYPGLAHRQQLIAEWQGLRFINDSKATNADSAGKALVCYKNIYWIIGGQPKEGGLSGLEDKVAEVRRAFIIGEAEVAFAKWCEGKIPFERCGDLATATRRAVATARAEQLPNSTVLLSPACASWDQFKSFEHRGVTFVALIHELTAQGIRDKGAA